MATEPRQRDGYEPAEAAGGEEGRAREDGEQGHPPLSAVQASAEAKEAIAGLTGRAADTVSGVEQADGGWRVRVEVVELERLPPSTDVLATYQVELDGVGEVRSYERVGRYLRGQPL